MAAKEKFTSEHAMEIWEEEVVEEARGRVRKVAGMLPVGLEHLQYLRQQVDKQVEERVMAAKEKFTSEHAMEISTQNMKQQIRKDIAAL